MKTTLYIEDINPILQLQLENINTNISSPIIMWNSSNNLIIDNSDSINIQK